MGIYVLRMHSQHKRPIMENVIIKHADIKYREPWFRNHILNYIKKLLYEFYISKNKNCQRCTFARTSKCYLVTHA